MTQFLTRFFAVLLLIVVTPIILVWLAVFGLASLGIRVLAWIFDMDPEEAAR